MTRAHRDHPDTEQALRDATRAAHEVLKDIKSATREARVATRELEEQCGALMRGIEDRARKVEDQYRKIEDQYETLMVRAAATAATQMTKRMENAAAAEIGDLAGQLRAAFLKLTAKQLGDLEIVLNECRRRMDATDVRLDRLDLLEALLGSIHVEVVEVATTPGRK